MEVVNYFVGEAKKHGNISIRLSPRTKRAKAIAGITKEVDFIYSDIDYEHIPGLVRPWDERLSNAGIFQGYRF
ncbi:MAG: hypothetical protein R3F36_14515 [Candidatus Competibacteraceae bacterium]